MPRPSAIASGGVRRRVDLDAEVHLGPDRLAQQAHRLDGVVHLLRMRLVVWRGLVLVEQRVEVAECGEAFMLQAHGLGDQRVACAALHVAVEARLVAHPAAEEFVDGHAEVLALDVPQRDVDRRDRAADGAAGEVVGAQHDIPVVLDRHRVAADEVLGILGDRGGAGLELAPGAGLADAGETRIRLDAGEAEAVDHEGFDFGDLHGSVLYAMRNGASAASSGSSPRPGALGGLTVPSGLRRSVSR